MSKETQVDCKEERMNTNQSHSCLAPQTTLFVQDGGSMRGTFLKVIDDQ